MPASLINLPSSQGKTINPTRRHKRRLKVEQQHSDSMRKKKLKLRQRLTQHASLSQKSTKFHKLLLEIHCKAWGKLWPTKTCVIRRCEIFPDKTNTGDDDEPMEIDDAKDDGAEDNDDDGAENNDDDDFGKIPEEAAIECLCNADLLQRAFNISGPPFEYIVVCEEYEFLRELLEAEIGDYILTGQPGTGKTVFLLYLLLYRLQLALPTAVQFSDNEYIVFKARGVSICATDNSTDHWSMLPEGCWCLTDGNPEVRHPCKPFDRNDLRTVLITSPRPDRFKKWRTAVGADTVITALPRAVEVAAIAEMNGWKASDAIAIMKKWGPCTRTVLLILAKPAREKSFERFATQASVDIYDDPSHVVSRELGKLPTGKGSTLLFIRPIRSNHDPDYTDSKFIIPTIYLSKIFDNKSQGISAEVRMRLYETFSLHPMTRTPAGWMHEKNMHLEMCTGKKRFKIWNISAKSHISSAALTPGGTASALRTAVCNRPSSFYWFPSIVNFVGIDGVLVDGDNIYSLQSTIAGTHDGPLEGLKKVWKTIGAAVAELFNWHFVLVSDNKVLAKKYAKELGTQLSDVYLGRKRLRVSVWVCVLKVGS